ncbi:15763_t:CDS:1, partial [Funneliformis caledonium]
NRIEEIGDNLYDNLQKKKTESCSIYNAKFTLNNIPCEIEYDLSHFTLQELDKLANLATENFNDDNINPIPTSLNENDNEQFILNNVPCEPLNLCSMCKETNDCFNLFSSKVNKIEKIVDNLHECISKRNEKLSKFTAQFSLNNVPCELEYDLSNFTLEELEKLGNFTIQNFNDKKYPSCTSPKKNENEDFDNVPLVLECNLPNFTLNEIEESKEESANDDNNHENESFIPYDLLNFTLEEFPTHNSNVDKYPSCISPKKNENEEFTADNIPFEFEYNFPYFTLDQLEESAIQDFNGDNNHENENFPFNHVPCELEYDLTNSLLE